MPNVPIRDTGKYGLNKDVSPVLLPPNGWSDGRNIRFDNGSVSKIAGHQSIMSMDTQALDVIYWPRPVDPVYVYSDATTVKSIGPTNTITSLNNVDNARYDSDGRWHSSLFNGGYTVIMNNGENIPQFISYLDSDTLKDLPAWPSGYQAGVLRSYRNVLVAGNITTSATDVRPGAILVSSQASPGNIPASWTVGDIYDTGTADEFLLSQTQPVLDIIDFRGACMIFTGGSIHQLHLASGGGATRVDDINRGRGVLATNCVAEFNGQLFVVDRNDVYVTSGSGQTQSVIDEKMKTYFFDNLNATHYTNTFVVNNLAEDEMWVCYPTLTSSGPCNEALIYNYLQKTWTIRDLPNAYAATSGPTTNGQTFDLNTDFLIMTGRRAAADVDHVQTITGMGTQSNQTTQGQRASYSWVLSGNASAHIAGVKEQQTLTINGSAEHIDAVPDIQTFTISGRSNVVEGEESFESVDFGVDSAFNSGTGSPTAYSVSNTSESIPAVSGTFTANSDASSARTQLRTALEADQEFNAAFAHSKDSEYALQETTYTGTKSTNGATANFAGSGVTVTRSTNTVADAQSTGTTDANVGGIAVTHSGSGNNQSLTFTNNNGYAVNLSTGTTGGPATLSASGGNVTRTGLSSNAWTIRSPLINDTGTGAGYAGGFNVDVTTKTASVSNYRMNNSDHVNPKTFYIGARPTGETGGTVIGSSTGSVHAATITGYRYGTAASAFSLGYSLNPAANGTQGAWLAFNTASTSGSTTYYPVQLRLSRNDSTMPDANPSGNFNGGVLSSMIQHELLGGTSTDAVLGFALFQSSSGYNVTTLGAASAAQSAAVTSFYLVDDERQAWKVTRGSLQQSFSNVSVYSIGSVKKVTGLGVEIETVPSATWGSIGTLSTSGGISNGRPTSTSDSDVFIGVRLHDTTTPTFSYSSGNRYDIQVTNNNNQSETLTSDSSWGNRTLAAAGTSNLTGLDSNSWTVDINGKTLYDFSVSNPTNTTATANGVTVNSGATNQLLVDDSEITSLAMSITRTPEVHVARYTARTDQNYDDFMYTLTANNGYLATPYLETQVEGASAQSSTYTLTDPSGAESVSFTSHVTSADSDDSDSVLSMLETAVDNNTETPINYTASITGNVLTVTADEGGAPDANWRLDINHHNVASDIRGTMASTHAVSQAGADQIEADVTITLTDPVDSTAYTYRIQQDSDSDGIAAAISRISVPDWNLSSTGNTVLFEYDSDLAISGSWTYSDVETHNSSSLSGTFVETTAGVTPVFGTVFSMSDVDGTFLTTTLGDSDTTDEAGEAIANNVTTPGSLSYNASTNRLRYDDLFFRERARPTIAINQGGGDGNLAVADSAVGLNGGEDRNVALSNYTLTLPVGFTPRNILIAVENKTLYGVLEAIRDGVNNTEISPGTVKVTSIANNQLEISYTGVSTNALPVMSVFNDTGNGDVTFGTAINEDAANTTSESRDLMQVDTGTTFNGETFNAFVERKNLNVGDLQATQYNKTIYPLMSGDGDVDIYVKSTNTAGKLVTLDEDNATKVTFDIDEDYKITPRQNGRFVNIRFESSGDNKWTLDGYSLNVDNEDAR